MSIGSVDVLVALSDTELRQLEPVVDGFRAGVVVAFAGRALGAFDDPYFVGVREDEETIVYRKGVHGMFGNTARFVGNDLVTRDTSVR